MKSKSAPRRCPRKDRFVLRLRLEQLEDRNLLSGFTHLDPGGPPNLGEQVPVNFVFVGYEADQVNEAAFRAALPSRSDPIIRFRERYGLHEQVGIHYTYDYRTTYTDAAYEDAFFSALAQLAVRQPTPTTIQSIYNLQRKNVLDVTHNHFIDASAVEKWIAANPPSGVNTRQDTVFFINWWGRDDFIFHTYSKFGEVDPDTGVDIFDRFRWIKHLNAWGGTTADDEETGLGELGTHRIWFHDLSAGPVYRGGGWNLDDKDLDGGAQADYRMPPIWEYLTPGGYRAATELTSDLAKLARYVAIDLYFTPSPVYPPYLTPDRLPDEINLDVNSYEGLPDVNGSESFVDVAYLADELSELYRIPFTVDHQDVALEGEAKECWEAFGAGKVCHREEGNKLPVYDVFYDAVLHLDELLDGPESTDGAYVYEAVGINYFDELADSFNGVVGPAHDNARDGTQSFVFAYLSSETSNQFGIGATGTLIHEYGHHFGMSHPHDGIDPELGRIDPTGDFYFLQTGDEVNSVMSYLMINYDFSQFDRDNANRWFAAAYVRSANNIAEKVLDEPEAPVSSRKLLEVADARIGRAKESLAEHDYMAMFNYAKQAYEATLQGARHAGIAIVPVDAGRTLETRDHGSGGDALGLQDTFSWEALEQGGWKNDEMPTRFESGRAVAHFVPAGPSATDILLSSRPVQLHFQMGSDHARRALLCRNHSSVPTAPAVRSPNHRAETRAKQTDTAMAEWGWRWIGSIERNPTTISRRSDTWRAEA